MSLIMLPLFAFLSSRFGLGFEIIILTSNIVLESIRDEKRWVLDESASWMAASWIAAFNLLSFNKAPLRETGCLSNSYIITGCSSIQFFNSPPFSNTVSVVTPGTLPATAQHLCDLWYHATQLVTRCFPLKPYLGKQWISL